MDSYANSLLQNAPGAAVYQAASFAANVIPTIAAEDDLRALIYGLFAMLQARTPIIVAITGHNGHYPKFFKTIEIGWTGWLKVYFRESLGNVDPVLNATPDTAIYWSKHLDRLDKRNPSQRKMLDLVKAHWHMHGLTYIHDFPTHRITLSFAGKDAEEDPFIRSMAELLYRMIARVASQIAGPDNLLYELSDREMSIFGHICDGHSDSQTASILGISEKTVQRDMARMISRYDASNRLNLISILLSGRRKMSEAVT